MSVLLYRQAGLQLNRREIARYLGCRGTAPDAALSKRIEQAAKALEQGSYRVCYLHLPVGISGDRLRFGGALSVQSAALAKNLSGCRTAVLFCASLGPAVDRAILSNRLHPLDAAIWDAAGTAAIEQLCDDFCAALPLPQKPRFSPGYGDLPLALQKDILALLDAGRLLGVQLTDSLLMTPAKSVTAFVGLASEEAQCN